MTKPRLHMEADASQLPMLYSFCEEYGIDDQALLALEEAMVNIASYSGASSIDLTYEDIDNAQIFTIEDDGIMFDPTAYAPCDGNAEALIAGGQGIRIIRRMMDTLRYQRANNKNILTLIKNEKRH